MRRFEPRGVRVFAALAAVSALAATGASPLNKRAEAPPKVEETLGDLAYIASATDTKLEGVGLVVGLDDTGADPPPSYYRQKLVDEMRKASVDHPNELLKSPKVAAVVVKMTVPAGVTPRDRLDIEVSPVPGSGTKSLAGGYLIQTRLRETLVAGGTPKEGQDAAFAQGPIMTGTEADPTNVKVGRVLGGGRVRKAIPYQLILKDNRKSIRNAGMVEAVVNQRFPQSEGVEQKGSANAKTDQYIVLKVPHVYHQNQDRFFRVVKLLPLVDGGALREQRVALWTQQLLDPKTAGVAALRLEGVGVTASDALKAGLASPNSQVRFFAAEALAYLNDASGADILADTAAANKDFRLFALAALAAMDQPASHIKLRKLMDEPDVELRYGAFNSLRSLSPDDPFLGQVRVLKEPPSDDDSEEAPAFDSMAAAITAARRKPRVEDPFSLYLVDCEGPPMVHVARTRRCEIVVFGRGMKIQPPVVLGHGAILLNAAEHDEELQISKIVPSRFTDSDEKVSCPFELGEVLRTAANLGASYPDLVTILQAADRQKNLPGPLVVDALPGQNPEYLKAAILGKDTTAKKDEAVTPTRAESTGPRARLRSLFGLRNNTPPARPEAASEKTAPAKKEQAVAPTGEAKKDEAVKPASGAAAEEKPAPASEAAPENSARRRSLLDRLRMR
ncbi:MAG: flagellar basal body P-ring protein FlgI [Isosphaeraceae bacterium]